MPESQPTLAQTSISNAEPKVEAKQGDVPAADASKIPPWKSLFAFTTRKDIPLLVFAAFCSIVASIANPAQAFITGKVFDGFIQLASGTIDVDGLVHYQRPWILWLVGIACVSWLSHFLAFGAWMTFGEIQAKNARTELFRGLSTMDVTWYDLCEDGIHAILPRLQTQIKDLQLATSQPLGGVLSLVSTSLIALGQAFYNSWDLTLVTLAGSPAIVAVIIYFGRRMQRAIDKQQAAREVTQKHSLEVLSNIETMKCFNAQEIELQSYWSEVLEAGKCYGQIVRANALQMALLAFLVQAMFVQAFYYGGVLIKNGKKQPSQVITTFFSAITAFQAIQGVIPQVVVLEKGRSAGAAIRQIMPSINAETLANNRQYKPFECRGNIHLQSVSFSYPTRPEQPALDDVDLVLPGGNMAFVIGKSGSGKSTLGQLLLRFYDPERGTILLDGENLQSFDLQWLRSNITLVEQASTLFDGTISENIALGARPGQGVSKHDIDAAIEFALLQSMIFDMPEGLATDLGQRADSLSGGQRQRIALARARLRDTAILILDESTSALDQINRELMMDAIRQWRQGKTTIVITHDISQIRQDDYAIVLEFGKVVQEGYRQHMETVSGSPFTRFIHSPDSTVVSLQQAYRQHVTQARLSKPLPKRPTSFFSAASIYLDTMPFRGFQVVPTISPRPDRSRSDSDLGRTSPGTDDSRSMPQKLQDLVMEAGQFAVASRRINGNKTRTRQKSIELDALEEADAPPKEQHPDLRRMLSMMWRDLPLLPRTGLLLGYLGGTVHAVCSPVFAFVLSKLLSLYAQPQDTSHMSIVYSLSILGIAALDAMHIFTYRSLLEGASQTWVDQLRKEATKRLLNQPLEFYDTSNDTASSLSETLDRHAEELRNLFGRFFVMLYVAAVILLVSFVWALSVEWKMTLMAMTAGPYIFVVASAYTRVSEKWERLSDDASREVNAVFAEAFGKVRTVRSLTLESHFHQKFVIAAGRSLGTGLRRAGLSGFFYGMSTSAATLATALVFYVGTKLVHDGASVTAVVQVFAILILTISNVSAILDYVPQMGSAKEMGWRVLRLSNLVNNSHEHSGDTRIKAAGQIQFKELDFAYPARPDAAVLKSVTFELKPGIVTAIVGGSGSGKSTVAKLLLKLYATAPSTKRSGLAISGRALRLIDTKSLRQVAAVVAQTSSLFNASIKANIVYGLPINSEYQKMDNVAIASKQAGIYDFIMSLPEGLDTMIGPGGMGLSGGQVQRIAIARALVRCPSLLILDEATSALDAESASLVRETIHELVRSKHRAMTIIMITHNREMMEIAKHVVVLARGQVVETGDYNTLLRRGGHLTNLLKGGAID